MGRYDHLVVNSTKYKKVKATTEFLYHHQIITKILKLLADFSQFIARWADSFSFVVNRKISYARRIGSLANAENNLIKDAEDASKFNSGYGYDDPKRELEACVAYRNQLLKKELGIHLQTESFELYDFALEKLTGLITGHDQISKMIDFGVSYAHTDSLLANKFPHIQFLGIDRAHETKAYNEHFFSNIENTSFVAGDIFDYLNENDCRNSVMFHMRTGVLLPKKFLGKLYSKCKEAGIDHIVMFEPHGISWATNESYFFSDEDQESLVFRGNMFLHNYPGILASAGYKVYDGSLVKTSHQDDDYRILYMAAELKQAG